MYVLIAGFEICNYLTRLAVPFLIPFIVRDFRFSETQRALLLNSFTPGYVLTQIPAGWLVQRFGTKAIMTTNCLGISAVMLALPVAAYSGGSLAVSACLVAFGVLQSSFAPCLWTIKAAWIPTGPERAWALMVAGFGTTIAKNLASFLTPSIAGRYGWRTASSFYAAAVGLYTCVWQAVASERPVTALQAGSQPSRGVTLDSCNSHSKARSKAAFGPMQLMFAAPVVANTMLHMTHDLAEMQILAFWAPTFYNQALGIPLHNVGRYTIWPMLCSIPAKIMCASWETSQFRKGLPLRLIRKRAALIACFVSVPCGMGFLLLRKALPITICYCGFLVGQIFDASVIAPNKLELGGTEDMPIIASWASTAAWSSGLLFASLLSALKQATGSWVPLFLVPLLLRICGTWLYVRNMTTRMAREYLAIPLSERRDYLLRQEHS